MRITMCRSLRKRRLSVSECFVTCSFNARSCDVTCTTWVNTTTAVLRKTMSCGIICTETCNRLSMEVLQFRHVHTPPCGHRSGIILCIGRHWCRIAVMSAFNGPTIKSGHLSAIELALSTMSYIAWERDCCTVDLFEEDSGLARRDHQRASWRLVVFMSP